MSSRDADLLSSNRLGISDFDALYAAERELSGLRSLELIESPIPGDLDLLHLKAIHHHLFQDVYEWAGEIREVSIAKGASVFALPQFIESEANKLFLQISTSSRASSLQILRFLLWSGYCSVLQRLPSGYGALGTKRINGRPVS